MARRLEPAQRNFVGIYKTYPDNGVGRLAEGGRRLKGVFAESRPEAPLVSIVTVCWNSARTIEQTIHSVINQSYGNIEYLVVDGASDDGTLDILRRFEDHIDYYVSEPDKGLYFAMNKGLELARGDYILILNSDDWYAPDCVELLLAAKRDSGADFVSALANYVDEAGDFIRLQPSFPYDASVYFRMPLRHETMLLSAALYEAAGPYDTQFFVNGDRVLTTRLYEQGYSHFELQKPVMFFRDTGVSSTDMDKLREERERVIARNFPGIDATDAATLARLETLEPEQLLQITQSYGKPVFAAAAAALARDRQARGTQNWQGVESATFLAAVDHVAPTAGSSPEKPVPALTIATLSAADHGGAGIGSQRRVEALRRHGVNAHIYCIFRKTDKPHVHQVPLRMTGSETELRGIWRAVSALTRQDHPGLKARELFSKAGSIVDFRDIRPVVQDSDIVHLHWVSGMFDYARANVLSDRPVVWTLADMNAFTGGCHYSEGCKGYVDECRDCPLLEDGSTLAHEIWKAKRDAYAKINTLHIICPSQWLADCAKESALLKTRPVHMIPNALPVDRFRPTNRIVARRKLGLPLTAKLVAFGADSLDNRRKGGDILAEAMRILSRQGRTAGMQGLFFGASSLDLGIKSHNMGHVSDEGKLSLIYSAADVFAFPSREDNAPLTFVEALLSGTQVVAFPVGNVPELVTHKDTGYIAKFADPEDFADGLAWALSDTHRPQTTLRSLRGYVRARRHNDPDIAAMRHLALYRTLVPGAPQSSG